MQASRPDGLRQRRPIAVLLLVQLLNGAVISAQRSFFPIYVSESLGFNAAVVSSFVSIAQVAGMMAAVVGGGLADTLGSKWTLIAGLGGFAASSLAFLGRAPWLVATLWAIGGVGMSLASLGAQSYLIRESTQESLGMASAFYHWGFTVGGALGSALAGWLLDAKGYGSFAGLAMGLVAFNVSVAILALPRVSGPHADSNHRHWRETVAGYLGILRQRRPVHLGLLRFLPTFYYGMSLLLLPLLIYAQVGTKASVARFAVVSQILAALAQLVAGRLADKLGPRLPTLVALVAVTTAAFGQALFAGQAWGLAIFGCLGVGAAWSLSALMPVLVSHFVVRELQGRVLGTLSLLWNLAMILGALVGGVLTEVRAGLPFFVASGVALAAIPVAVAFFDRRDAKTVIGR